MPANRSGLGALPARFRRERVLIVGCGDVGRRAVAVLAERSTVFALTSSPDKAVTLRQLGVVPLIGDLDQPRSVRRLAGLATRVLHLAPPPRDGDRDPRTAALVQALRRRTLPASLVYGSTSGVYGDCGGARVDERRPVAPTTARARRRVDAERRVRRLLRDGVAIRILRIPGIYAPDRDGGMPIERLTKGTPVLRREDDVFTNHIHADDLARACVLALWRVRRFGCFNISDDSEQLMSDYFDLAADLFGLPRPPRLARDAALAALSPMQASFMGESRRLDNTRMKRALGLRLAWPTVAQGLLGTPTSHRAGMARDQS